MTQPHISAVLNNCPLHALTPELLDVIQNIAETRVHPTFAYHLLKDRFAEFYGFNKEAFSWQQFSQLLTSYNPFDVQLILGPVLRLLLKDIMSMEQHQQDVLFAGFADESIADLADSIEDETRRNAFIMAEYIKRKSNLQADGRYESLSPDELHIFLTKHLRFNLRYHQNGQSSLMQIDEAIEPLATIDIYHQGGIDGAGDGGHWERTATVDEIVHYEHDEHTKLYAHAPLLGNHEYTTQFVLTLLKKHVQLTFRASHAENVSAQFTKLALTLAQIEKFNYSINFLPKPDAEKLLGSHITSKTIAYIKGMPKSEVAYDPRLRALVYQNMPEQRRYNPTKPGQRYTPEQYKIALILLTPPVVAIHPSGVSATQDRFVLSANDISSLSHTDAQGRADIEYILYENGLSTALYNVCNKEEIAPQLSDALINILIEDDYFKDKAAPALLKRAQSALHELEKSKQRAARLLQTPTYLIPHATIAETLDNIHSEIHSLIHYAPNVHIKQLLMDLDTSIDETKDINKRIQQYHGIGLIDPKGLLMTHLFEIKTSISMFHPRHFEGKGEVLGEATQSNFAKIYYVLIVTLRFALNYIMSLFTKIENNRNPLAEVMGRPYFFLTPQSAHEQAKITSAIDQLSRSKQTLDNLLQNIDNTVQQNLAY